MQFELPCECGRRHLITTGDAGATIRCECNRTIQAPGLRELRALPPARPTEIEPVASRPSDDERVGIVTRGVGGVLVVLGVGLIGLAVWGLFTSENLKRKGAGILGAIGGGLCYVGVTWIQGKKYFNAKIDPDSDTPEAGRSGLFGTWPEDCRRVIDVLRPSLLATGAVFAFGDKFRRLTRPRIRIGWPGFWSMGEKGVLAVVRPCADGSLEFALRVGPNSGLIGRDGPFQPITEGKLAGGEYGVIILTSGNIPDAIHDWVARAGEFTQAQRKGRTAE